MESETVYGAFVDYYGDIPLILTKNENGYGVYACRVSTQLSEARVIFVIVPAAGYLPEKTSLNNVNWISFQTRITELPGNIPSVTLMPGPDQKKLLSDQLNYIDRTRDRTDYLSRDLPIKVTLLHDPRKNNSLQYPDSCKLYQALETYRCVVEML